MNHVGPVASASACEVASCASPSLPARVRLLEQFDGFFRGHHRVRPGVSLPGEVPRASWHNVGEGSSVSLHSASSGRTLLCTVAQDNT